MANTKSNKSLYGMNKQIPEQASQNIAKKSQIKKSENIAPNEVFDTLIVVPPDGGWGWLVVIASFFSNFVADGTMYTFGLFLEEISISIGCTKTEIALANSIMTGFYFLTGPFIGALINRYGFRIVAVIGGIIGSAAITVTTFCTTLHAIILIYGVIGGVGLGMMYLSSTVVVGFYFERWRALAQSVACCGSSLGMICFPPIFTILLKNYEWRIKFRVLAGLVLASGILCLLYRPLHPIRVVAVDERKVQFFSDKDSLLSVATVVSTFSKYHNMGYPTTADIHGQSIITITEPRRMSSASVLVSASGPSTSVSRASVKPVKSGVRPKVSNISRSKASAERLRTVYEEEERREWKCQRCCRTFKQCCTDCCFYFCCCPRVQEHITAARPLYRDDIFFSGSIMALPEYARSIQSSIVGLPSQERSRIDYHLSVSRIATQKDLEQDFTTCVCCPESMKRTLATMLDISVLKSPSFLLLSLSGFFTTLGLFTPFVFIADRAKNHGMEGFLTFYLISTLGISNTVGRIMSGVLSSIPNVKALLISYISLTICGVSTLMSSSSFSVQWQFGFASVYGLTVACVAALRPVIVVDMLGLEKLTNGFGISLVFQGMASLSGVPLSGCLKNITGDYELSFYFAGGVILLSAIMLMPIKKISNWEKRKQTQMDVQQAARMSVNIPK